MNNRFEEFPEYVDEIRLVGPLPATDGQRMSSEKGFPSGPEVGEALPGFSLRNQKGDRESDSSPLNY